MTKERKYSRSYTDKIVVDTYLSGKSLNQLYDEIGVSPVTAKKILLQNNVNLRKDQVEYKDIIKMLEAVNIGKEEIYNFYIIEGKSQRDLATFITEQTGVKVGQKVVTSMLKFFNIKKSAEQIKRAQANKSLSEKAYSYSMLKIAGFDSAKELAEFYESNSNMTYTDICEMLNRKIGKDVFTPRWLGRHMAKELSDKKKSKTSIGEKSLFEYISDVYEGEILTNNYDIIPPKEIDIYLPELNIGIEYNGLYWHSDKFIIANHGITAYDYHLNKSLECSNKDIQLIFVWEDDWEESKDSIKKQFPCFLRRRL